MKQTIKLTKALTWFLAIEAVIFAFAFYFSQEVSSIWFQNLAKPGFFPPTWVFRLVWFVILLLFGFGGYFIWLGKKTTDRAITLFVWGLQNFGIFLWTILFFELHKMKAALVEIFILDLLVLVLLYYSYRSSRVGFWLILPYAVWIYIDTIIHWTIYLMN